MKSAKDTPEQISESIEIINEASYGGHNEYYGHIIEAAQDMIFIHDLKGNVTYINRASVKETGYSEEELLSMNVAQNVPPEYYPKMQELEIKRMQGNREVFTYEMEYFKKNGERIPVRVSSSPIYKDDTLTGVIQIVRNISDLKKAEKILALQTELSSKICQTNTLDSALEDVLKTALEIGDVDCGGIYIVDEKTSTFKLKCFKNISDKTLSFFENVSSKSKFIRGPLFVNGDESTNGISKEMLDNLRNKENLKFFSIIPFFHMGKPLGSLNIGSHEKDDIPALSKKILVALSQELGGAIARIRSEEAMKESEQKYRQIVESANSIICKFDKNGIILSINEYGASFFGYSRDEIIGRCIFETIVPEYESNGRNLKNLVGDICTNEKDYRTFINENIKKNGDRVWINWSNKQILDKDGNLTNILAIGNDISEQRKLAEEIKFSEIKFKTLFEKAYEPIFILDQDLFIKDTNNSSLELFHFSKDEIIGMSIYDLIAPLETKRLQYSLSHGFESPNLFMEANFMKNKGQIFPAEINLTTLEIKGEKSVICTLRDITEQKIKEDGLKKQILKYELNEGNLYFSKEPSNLLPFEAFREIIDIGYKGTIISRSELEHFEIEDIEFDYFWLSSRKGKNTLPYNLKSLREFFQGIKCNSVILIDSIDYLIIKNGFIDTYNFITELRDIAYFGNNIIILSIDKDSVDPKQLKLIEKETKPIVTKSADALNNKMIEIIKYILNQNKLGINPTYSSLGKDLVITRPTVRKNVRYLESNRYIIVHRKGRNKRLEVTEKGKKLL